MTGGRWDDMGRYFAPDDVSDELELMLASLEEMSRGLMGTQVEDAAKHAVCGLLVDLGILTDRLRHPERAS